MRYILVDTQVNAGTPNRVTLHVLTRDGWLPWSEVDGKTNCTDPEQCPLLSFGTRFEAWRESLKSGGQVVPVDTTKVVYSTHNGDTAMLPMPEDFNNVFTVKGPPP